MYVCVSICMYVYVSICMFYVYLPGDIFGELGGDLWCSFLPSLVNVESAVVSTGVPVVFCAAPVISMVMYMVQRHFFSVWGPPIAKVRWWVMLQTVYCPLGGVYSECWCHLLCSMVFCNP